MSVLAFLSGKTRGADARRGRLAAAGFIIALWVGMAFLSRHLPWSKAWFALREARLPWIAMAVAANGMMFPIWASQWRLLAPREQRPRWLEMLRITGLVSLAQSVFPALAGQAAAVGLLVSRGRLSRGAALSVVAVDQSLTGLGKLAVIGLAAFLMPLPAPMRDGGLALMVGVAAFISSLVVIARGSERLLPWAEGKSTPVAKATMHLIAWARELEPLRKAPGRFWGGFAYALGKKACEILAALAIQYGCGLPVSLSAAVLVVAALGMATLLRTPGNLGVYEATVILIYGSLGMPPAPTLAAALLQHFAALIPRIGLGLIVLIARRPVSPQQC